jgi:hypothetical protein
MGFNAFEETEDTTTYCQRPLQIMVEKGEESIEMGVCSVC